jgi:hypothetical protein
VYLCICLPFCSPVFLPVFPYACLSVRLSICQRIRPSNVFPSICSFVCPSFCPSILPLLLFFRVYLFCFFSFFLFPVPFYLSHSFPFLLFALSFSCFLSLSFLLILFSHPFFPYPPFSLSLSVIKLFNNREKTLIINKPIHTSFKFKFEHNLRTNVSNCLLVLINFKQLLPLIEHLMKAMNKNKICRCLTLSFYKLSNMLKSFFFSPHFPSEPR